MLEGIHEARLFTTSIRMALGYSERFPALNSHYMFQEHRRFSRKAGRLGLGVNCIALPNAALEIFQRCRGVRVLHMVNGHPLEHNLALARLGLPHNHHELIPQFVVDRVISELELADLVLVPSRVVAEGLVRWGVMPDKLRTVPYGVDPELFTAKHSGREVRARQILFVGQISYRKGVHILVEAARSLPHERVLLAGPIVSPEILHNLPSNVRYLGRLSRSEVARIMRTSTVFTIPSLEDAYPLVAIEALAAGCQLVATSVVGTNDLLDPRAAITCDVGDVASLVRALKSALTLSGKSPHPPRAWSWDEYCQATLSVLSSWA